MSTLSNNITARRIALLAGANRQLFHVSDLAVLFELCGANMLRVTLYRLVRAGILYRLQRGLYSIVPPEKIDPATIGSAFLHRFCYLSTESVLRDAGIILQSLDVITFMSDVSRKFVASGHRYLSRRLHPRFLHHPLGIDTHNGLLRASPERAIADMLYIDPYYHFDRPVNWKRIRMVQQKIGYPFTPHRYVDSTSR